MGAVKSLIRFAFTAAGVALIAIGIGAILFSTQLEGLALSKIEGAMSNLFDTQVRIESMKISPFDSSFELRHVTVENPENFKEGPALECERVRVRFDLKSLASRTPTIDELIFDGTTVNLRHELGKGTNIGRLTRRAASVSELDSEELQYSLRKQFHINRLRSEDAKVVLSTNLVPLSKVGVRVVTVDLTGVSPDEPISTPKVAAIFLRSVIMETITMKGLLRPVASKLKEEIADLGERLGVGGEKEKAPAG